MTLLSSTSFAFLVCLLVLLSAPIASSFFAVRPETGESFPVDSQDGVIWWVQVSDIHVSSHDHSRADDLEAYLAPALKIIQPAIVLVTGDLTDAKNRDRTVTRQDEGEWKRYAEAVDAVAKESGVRGELFVDVRGNHDTFEVPARGGPQDFFARYSRSGRHNRSSVHKLFLVEPSGSRHLLVGLDAAPLVGLRGPANFFGHPTCQQLQELDQVLTSAWDTGLAEAPVTAVAYGHYPISFLAQTPGGERAEDVLRRHPVAAYLSGHLHRKFGSRLYYFHKDPGIDDVDDDDDDDHDNSARGRTDGSSSSSSNSSSRRRRSTVGFWEWVAGDWRESRMIRIVASDRGQLSFVEAPLLRRRQLARGGWGAAIPAPLLPPLLGSQQPPLVGPPQNVTLEEGAIILVTSPPDPLHVAGRRSSQVAGSEEAGARERQVLELRALVFSGAPVASVEARVIRRGGPGELSLQVGSVPLVAHAQRGPLYSGSLDLAALAHKLASSPAYSSPAGEEVRGPTREGRGEGEGGGGGGGGAAGRLHRMEVVVVVEDARGRRSTSAARSFALRTTSTTANSSGGGSNGGGGASVDAEAGSRAARRALRQQQTWVERTLVAAKWDAVLWPWAVLGAFAGLWGLLLFPLGLKWALQGLGLYRTFASWALLARPPPPPPSARKHSLAAGRRPLSDASLPLQPARRPPPLASRGFVVRALTWPARSAARLAALALWALLDSAGSALWWAQALGLLCWGMGPWFWGSPLGEAYPPGPLSIWGWKVSLRQVLPPAAAAAAAQAQLAGLAVPDVLTVVLPYLALVVLPLLLWLPLLLQHLRLRAVLLALLASPGPGQLALLEALLSGGVDDEASEDEGEKEGGGREGKTAAAYLDTSQVGVSPVVLRSGSNAWRRTSGTLRRKHAAAGLVGAEDEHMRGGLGLEEEREQEEEEEVGEEEMGADERLLRRRAADQQRADDDAHRVALRAASNRLRTLAVLVALPLLCIYALQCRAMAHAYGRLAVLLSPGFALLPLLLAGLAFFLGGRSAALPRGAPKEVQE